MPAFGYERVAGGRRIRMMIVQSTRRLEGFESTRPEKTPRRGVSSIQAAAERRIRIKDALTRTAKRPVARAMARGLAATVFLLSFYRH